MKKILIVFLMGPAFLAVFPAFASASVVLGNASLNALSTGLVGYWPFDGNTTNWTTGVTSDMSGNGNSGQLIGMSTSTSPVTGKIGQALNFNGTNQYVDTGSYSLMQGATSGTISVWINPTSIGGTNYVGEIRNVIVGKASGPDNGLGFSLTTNQIMLRLGNVTNLTSNTALSTGKWYQVVGTWNSSGMNIYINGVLDNSNNVSSAALTSSAYDIQIGRMYSGNTNGSFDGVIDDVRIYNRALSTQEVALLYAMGSFDLGNTPATNSSFSIDQGGLNSGLVAYWPLDGNTTNWATGVTKDVSGNNYNGQMTGMSTSSSPVPGKIGQALSFNGSSNYITTGYTVPAQSSATSFTWSVWTKINSGVAPHDVIIGNRGGGGSTWVKLTPTAFEYNGSIISYTIPTGQWLLLTIVKNGSNFTYYQNGVVVGTASNSGSTSAYTFYMGEDPGDSGDGDLTGTLDDVRIYNRALSQQEVQQLYGAGEVNIGHSNTTSGTGLNSGLVGYWTFDGPTINWATGVAKDMSGSGNNGQLEGMSTTTSPTIGKIGQALSFNGSNGYLSVSPYPSNTSPLTVSAWVYPTSLSQASFGGGTGGSIVDENESGGSAGWDFGIDGTHSDELWFWPSGSNDKRSTGSVSLNKWTLVTATYDGTNLRFYLNGVLDSTQVMSAPQGSATFFKIGAKSWITGYWQGKLDDVRIYNRALSAQEIAQLYAMGK